MPRADLRPPWRMRAAAAVLLAPCLFPAVRAAESGEAEVAALIAALGESGCEFERNGRWYGADRAQAHVRRKYAWLQARGLADTAELFIERAASRSSRSGRPYHVRCPGEPVVEAARWFGERLRALRARREAGAAPSR